MCDMNYTAERAAAAAQLAGLIERELRLKAETIAPYALYYLLNTRWAQIATLAHAVHGTKPAAPVEPDKGAPMTAPEYVVARVGSGPPQRVSDEDLEKALLCTIVEITGDGHHSGLLTSLGVRAIADRLGAAGLEVVKA